MKWKAIELKGNLPEPRTGHSAISFGSNIMYFGGSNLKNKYFNDSFLLNTKITYTMHELTTTL